MKDVNGNIIPDSNHRIGYNDRREILYELYTKQQSLFELFYNNKIYSKAKMIASVLGQPLYDATKSSKHYTGYFTTGAVKDKLKPGEASVEHSYGRTDAALEIFYEGIRKGKNLTYEEFCEMIDRYCFTVHATREENRNLSIKSREDRNRNWIEVYQSAGVDLYVVPVKKVGRSLVYEFDNAEKVEWDQIKEELAY